MTDVLLLQKLFAVTRIPLQLCERGKCLYDSGGFDPSPSFTIIQGIIDLTKNSCYTVAYEHQYYGVVKIEAQEEYILAGPVMTQDCTRNQARRILSDLQQPLNRLDELLVWINATPLCDLQRFINLLTYLNYLFNGQSQREPVYVPYSKGAPVSQESLSEPDLWENFGDLLEKEMVSCVEYGKPERLETLFARLERQNESVPPVASNTVRAFKNICLFAIGVASRSALKGGMDYATMNELTSRYLRQIEALDQYTDLYALFKQFFLDFARRTARSRMVLTHTAVVKNISKVVLSRIYEKTTPTQIAGILGMNVSYICTHFKRETGKTISEYVNETKVAECKRLLETTNLPIIQISEQLGYSSQNYLITVFKKITGSTPMEYRKGTF